jgi:catechol 2,3-dioxygenase-like lactoylglutathione lyase family enzyme
MAYHQGRLIDHVGLRMRDFPAARRFYRAILEALGRGGDVRDSEDSLDVDELYIEALGEGGAEPSRVHLCFQAVDREMVARFHAAGLAAGGRDNGAPGLRDYHPGYYAAFLLDPDGNNIEAKVDERVTSRSTGSVTVATR